MAVDIIQARYEELDQIAGRFGHHADASRELQRRVAAGTKALVEGGWQGAGAGAFSSEMNATILPAMRRLTQLLVTAQDVTLQLIEIFRQAEIEAGAPFKGAAQDGLPRSNGSTFKGGQDRPPSPSEVREQFERKRYFMPDRGVGFAFDGANPVPGDVERWHSGLSEAKRQALEDPRTVVTIKAMASRPGTEAYNQRLTEQRGEALTKELQGLGVQAQIKVEAVGEQEARKADRSLMSPRPPSDNDKADGRDNAIFRTATIEIEPFATDADFNAENVTGQRLSKARLNDELAKGEQTFEQKIAGTLGEQVRKIHPSPENPFLPRPSRDPDEFLGQAGEQIKDFATDPKETIAKMGAGIFLDGAIIKMQEQVAIQRQPAYDAIAQGVAGGLDPSYADSNNWQPKDDAQRALYDGAKRTVEGLSEREQEQLGLFLTQRGTEFEQSYNYLTPRLDGSHFRDGVTRYFDSDKHYDRE